MDPSQLAQVEELCRALYQGTSSVLRAEAQQQLLTLQSTVDFIPQCQFILENSSLPYAQLVATTSLENLVTQFWNSFTLEQKLDVRNFVLRFLGNNASVLQEFVIGNLTKLACRITKLGWFDSPEHREIIEEIRKFLEASVDHSVIGLKLLNSLVDEMNSPTIGRSLTVHRKTAVSFRDQTLLQIFEISVITLRNLLNPNREKYAADKEQKIMYLCLSLATASLSFDFIGTNPEESAEDVGTVQVPSPWRTLLQDTATMELFFECYLQTEPPRSSLALEALVQLSSVRRSLFASEKERTVFLQALMTGIQSVMTSQKGLEHIENYHQFCRLLGRLKASYQLSELVKTHGFMEWLELAGNFTIKSLQNWQYSMNSIHYLLALWGRLVAALPYLRADATDSQRQAQTLRQCVLQVVESYIKTMLDSVDVVVASDGGVDDPLEDEGSLKEQMERLPVIARLQYDTVAQYLLSMFEQSLTHYEQGITLAATPQLRQRLLILEGRMTWLTYMVAAVIDAQATTDPHKGQAELLWDGRLSRCVFKLVQVVDFRLNGTSGQGKCDAKLEIAILNYFRAFKKVYMLESPSSQTTSSLMGMTVPGGSPAHPLLSLALSGMGRAEDKEASAEINNVSFTILTLVMCIVTGERTLWPDLLGIRCDEHWRPNPGDEHRSEQAVQQHQVLAPLGQDPRGDAGRLRGAGVQLQLQQDAAQPGDRQLPGAQPRWRALPLPGLRQRQQIPHHVLLRPESTGVHLLRGFEQRLRPLPRAQPGHHGAAVAGAGPARARGKDRHHRRAERPARHHGLGVQQAHIQPAVRGAVPVVLPAASPHRGDVV
jgi:exportin-7